MFRWILSGAQFRTSGRVLIFLGILLWAAFSLAISTTVGTHAGMLLRESQRSLTVSQDGTKTNLRAKWIPTTGIGSAHGYMFAPESGDAPEPPGMNGWIGPGYAMLSQSLVKEYPVGTQSPWGEVSGVIPNEVLSLPTERYFYARVKSAPPMGWGEYITGFGAGSPLNGDILNTAPIRDSIIFFSAMLAFPAVTLIFVGILQTYTLRKSLSLLYDLGLSRANQLAYSMGACLKPLALATLIVGATVIYASVYGLHLPIVNNTIVASDIRSHLPLFGVIAIVGLAILLLCSACNVYLFGKFSTHQRNGAILATLSRLAVLPSIVFTYVFITFTDLRGLTLQLVLLGSIISTALAIPALAIGIVSLVSGALEKLSMRGASLFAHRKILKNASTLIVTIIGASSTLVLIGSSQLYAMQMSEDMGLAINASRIIDNRAVSTDVSDLKHDDIQPITRELARFGGIMIASQPDNDGRTIVTLDSAVREALMLTDAEPGLITLSGLPHYSAAILGDAGVSVEIAAKHSDIEQPYRLYVVSTSPINLDALYRQGIELGLEFKPVASNWLEGAKLTVAKVDWFILFGSLAAVSLLISSANSTYKHAKEKLKLAEASSVYFMSRVAVAWIAILSAFLPMAVVSVLALGEYRALAAGFRAHSFGISIESVEFEIALLLSGIATAVYLAVRTYKESL